LRTAAGSRRHPQARELHPLNIHVTEARRKVLTHIVHAEGVGSHHCKIPVYAYAGSQDNVVLRESAQDSFTNASVLPGDHHSILDPDSEGNRTFSRLKTLLHKHLLATAETESAAAGQSGPDARNNESLTGAIRARPALGTDSPLIEEALYLTVTSEGIQSVRMREGGPGDRVLLAVPSVAAMEEYHRALRESAALTAPPDEATVRRIRGLMGPLQEALLPAVPESVRRRLAAESVGQAGVRAAIELRLMDGELEKYPWELIAEAADVVVWRKVSSLGPSERWTSNLLLTGTAGMREARDELAGIRNELSDCRHLEVFDCPGDPPDLSHLLRMHRPAAFHMVSYPAGQSAGSRADGAPGIGEQRIQPQSVAADFRRSGVWAAVLNYGDSATASAAGSRPPAGEIAARSGAATIGMAGQMHPGAGQLFAIKFYHCLAQGFSVLHAYHEAVRGIRDHGTYAAMWSIPVMYANSPNVIPFPVSHEAQARLSLEQIRLHVRALDGELQRLARGNYRSAGEWARQAAIPIVRTQCIVRYLTDATASGPAANEQERRRQERLDRAREDFRSVLYATEASLRRLGRTVGPAERHKVLAELPLRRQQQRQRLGMLDDLVKEAR
jgi:hypothetical protein